MRSGARKIPNSRLAARIMSSRGVLQRLTGRSSSSSAVDSKCTGSLMAAEHNSPVMSEFRAAVIGVGYLGRVHAQKYAQAADCKLVAVVDPRAEARAQAAREFAVEVLADHRELLGRVDLVSIVTPTPTHFAIARDFLAAGTHVLLEKPVTETLAEARELIALARREKRILQVGHL